VLLAGPTELDSGGVLDRTAPSGGAYGVRACLVVESEVAAVAAVGADDPARALGGDRLGWLVGREAGAHVRAVAVADQHAPGAAGVGPVDLAAGETALQGHLAGH